MSRDDPVGAGVRSLYQEVILDHYRSPRNRGELPGADVTVHRNNPTCGDEITLQLRMEDGHIVDGRFSGHGCAISQASASMMTELLRGATPDDAHALADRFREMLHGDVEAARDKALGDLRSLAGVAKYPSRVRCAMLAWAAMEDAVRS